MKQKLVSLLLLAALVLGQLPAAAVNTESNTNEPQVTSVTVVNPLYGEIGDDVPPSGGGDSVIENPPNFEQEQTEQNQYGASVTTPYTKISDAADFVRSQMANRQPIIVLSYRTTVRSNSEDPKVGIVKGIVSKALEETGQEYEGDYLRWQYGKYVCDIQSDVVVNGDGTSTYWYKFIYSFVYYTTGEQERKLNEQLADTLRELEIDQMTDYQKIQSIYSYICDHVRYDGEDETTLKYTAYSALTRGTAVCQGYALLLYRMLREAGFSTRIIAGTATASGENHAWNIVQLGDRYYYLDSTWDAGSSWRDYFLCGKDGFLGHEAWSDYTTTDFLETYPMADTSYMPTDTDEPESVVLEQGVCGNDIRWSLKKDGVLQLRGSGRMNDYTSGQAPWEHLNGQITALDIGCGITSIGSYAFSGCTALKTAIILPDSIKQIGSNAFAGCTQVPSIDILPSAQEIAADAFAKNMHIRGCTGSTAETIASQQGLVFEPVISIAALNIQLSQSVYSYTGNACEPSVTVTTADGQPASYTVTYFNHINAGTAQVMVSGTGDYGGKTDVSFCIEKAVPQIETPQGFAALCGQNLNDVLTNCRFTWQEPKQQVGMQPGKHTFLMTYTPIDTQNYTAVTDIPVTVSVYNSIGLSSTKTTTHVGAELRLIPSAIPNNAPQDILFWSSDQPKVASVSSDGIVSALSEGTAVITVRSVAGECATCTITVEKLPFSDVKQTAWYYHAVSYACGNGLFAGMTPTTFGPSKNMTRAMLVQVLYSMSGAPEVTGSSPFSDVPDGKWYTNAIIWAAQNGIVAGTGNGKFSPTKDVTREQTAAILCQYAHVNGYPTISYISISSYDDDQDVSSWAIHAMQWAVGNNLISGTDNNRLQPRGKATRAQLAQIMMKFQYNIVYG